MSRHLVFRQAHRAGEPMTRHRTAIYLAVCMLTAAVWPAIASAAEPVAAEPMLSAHNAVRSQHDLQPLHWSTALAEEAADWAAHLAEQESCRMVHSEVLQGENLFWASPRVWSDGRTQVQPIKPEDVVRSWASEQEDYDYASNSCRGEQCGHYTQIVWAESQEVGCAKHVCEDQSQLWVCRYRPPGNVVGERPY